MITIRNEKPEDYFEVEKLVRSSFWDVYRPGAMEHFVLHKYRDDKDFVKELDFVTELDGKIIGQTIFVKSEIELLGGGKLPVLTFGPICIDNRYKRMGYGKMLLDYSLEKAKEWGAGATLITGNIDFYGKSGFVPASKFGIRYSDADHDDKDVIWFLAKELKEGYLEGANGTYKDPEGYFVCQNLPKEFEEFDKRF